MRIHANADNVQTILVVDCEREVLVLIAEVLRRSGYRVVAVDKSADALSVCADTEQSIDLAVFEISMPAGRDLARRLVEIRPAIKCVPMSASPVDFREMSVQSSYCLAKPFSISELLDAVHKALTKSS